MINFGSSSSNTFLDSVTPGTAAASRAVVLDADGKIDTIDITAPKIGGTNVDATALELNRATDLSARVVAAGDALSATLAAHSDRTILLDTASGSVVTLPVAAATGARIRCIVSVKPTSNAHIVKVANSSGLLAGSVNLLDADSNAQTAYAFSGTDDTLTWNGTTTGGQIGDWVEFEDILTNVWAVRGQSVCPAGSNVADPSSATV